MSTQTLPDNPDLDHLRQQARDLLAAGDAAKVSEAQFKVARLYGFASWPKLKAHVQSLQEIGQLKAAIDREDLAAIQRLMTANPALHGAPLGYGKNGPLTWVAECRVPRRTPSPERLAIARWMLENGSDVHQGGDGPLMRASLADERIPMMELLVAHGADVNALWNGSYPILLAPCETQAPESLRWLLKHGARPDAESPEYGNAIAMLLGTYARNPAGKHACLEVFTQTGFDLPDTAPLALHRGSMDLLEAHLRRDPDLLARRFAQTEIFPTELGMKPDDWIGATSLHGGTLLHLAVETGDLAAARWLLERGADPNTRAGESGDGHTALFHTAVAFGAKDDAMARLLLERGADPNLRATLRRTFPWLDDPDQRGLHTFADVTPIGYALQYPHPSTVNHSALVQMREHGGTE